MAQAVFSKPDASAVDGGKGNGGAPDVVLADAIASVSSGDVSTSPNTNVLPLEPMQPMVLPDGGDVTGSGSGSGRHHHGGHKHGKHDKHHDHDHDHDHKHKHHDHDAVAAEDAMVVCVCVFNVRAWLLDVAGMVAQARAAVLVGVVG